MKLSFKGLWQRWLDAYDRWVYYNPYEERQSHKWAEFMKAQREALRLGAEIDPPWVVFPNADPCSFRQGFIEDWRYEIWLPFWERLTKEERIAYVKKWNAPPDWRDVLGLWLKMEIEEQKNEQRD